MGAKFKSKTHFLFLRRFLRVLLQSLKKVLIWKVSKNAEFHADFESVEKVLEKCTQKILSKTILMNMSKSVKTA